jgi:hypothetical protein
MRLWQAVCAESEAADSMILMRGVYLGTISGEAMIGSSIE